MVRLALVAASFAIYAQTLRFEFVSYDDPRYLLEPPLVRGGLSLRGLAWAPTAIVAGSWHPVTLLSHMLDWSLFGLNPAGHHLTSVLLHAANSVLVFEVLRRLTGAFARSALVAALFAVHPLHVESVAWVAERKDVLCAFFGLLALRAWGAYARSPRPGTYLLAALWLLLGLASKPMLVTLPFVFLLLDYWPLDRMRSTPLRRLLLEKVPLLLLSAATVALTLAVQGAHGALAAGEWLPLRLRVAHAAVSWVWYAAKLAWPSDLGLLYPHPYLEGGTPWAAWQIAGSVALLLGVSGWVYRFGRRPYAIVGWSWYLGMLVPVIGLVQAGVQGMADRYAYLPSIGLSIFAVWGGAELASRVRSATGRRAIAAACGLCLAALAAAAWLQTRHWRDSVVLYERSLEVTGGRSRVHAALGAALRTRGQLAEAIAIYRRGLELYPDEAMTHSNLGNALLEQRRVGEAIEHFRAAVRANPGYAMAHANLALALAANGDFADAIAAAREAVRLAPEGAPASKILADVLAAGGRHDEAIEQYREALRLQPDFPAARAGLAAAEAARGRQMRAPLRSRGPRP
jgi:tetratricopeptide (TPR) repeat protein